MRIMRGLTFLTAALLLACLFLPWVIQPNGAVVSGFRSDTDRYGMPGLFHLILVLPFLVLFFLNRSWSLKTAFFIGAFNVAWAVRNFISISSCAFGDCPQKQPAIYGILISSILLVIFLLFVDTPRPRVAAPEEKNS